MSDPNITYERLREVSTAGYKMLIVVAAVLQYVGIAEDLRELKRKCIGFETSVGSARLFVEALKAPGLSLARRGASSKGGVEVVPSTGGRRERSL
jgi:hypothetical protein